VKLVKADGPTPAPTETPSDQKKNAIFATLLLSSTTEVRKVKRGIAKQTGTTKAQRKHGQKDVKKSLTQSQRLPRRQAVKRQQRRKKN